MTSKNRISNKWDATGGMNLQAKNISRKTIRLVKKKRYREGTSKKSPRIKEYRAEQKSRTADGLAWVKKKKKKITN